MRKINGMYIRFCDNYGMDHQGNLIALASFSEGRLLDKMKSVAVKSLVAFLSQMTTALGQLAIGSFLAEVLPPYLPIMHRSIISSL